MNPSDLATPVPAAGVWVVDPTRSTAAFTARHLLTRQVTGTVPVRSGRIDIGPDGRVRSVEGVLDMAGIATGHPRRDADLRGRRFFRTDAFPELTFRADTFRHLGETRQADGELTVADRTAPLTLDATAQPGPGTAEWTVTATATLDLRAAGVRVPSLFIGRWVAIRLTALLRQGG